MARAAAAEKILVRTHTARSGMKKKTNYALQPQTKEDFVKAVTSGLNMAPKYFAINARINQQGYEELGDVKAKGMKELDIPAFKTAMNADEVIILDTRLTTEFTNGFIPGSISIGLEGRFAEWAGIVLPFDKPIILVTHPGKEEESVIRLARVGFDKMQGYLKGGFEAWVAAGEKIDMIIDVEADELIMDIPHDPNLVVLDVRKDVEFADGHLADAVHVPLDEMTDVANIAQFEEGQNVYIHCAGGYRSVIAASLMKRQGVHNIRNVLGGWNKIKLEDKAKIVKEASVLN